MIPEIDDDKGVSEVFVHHGEKLDLSCLEKIKMESYNQYSVEKSSEKRLDEDSFFGLIENMICGEIPIFLSLFTNSNMI